MKLFKLTRPENKRADYGDYDCCVVVALDEEDARTIHPNEEMEKPEERACYDYSWINPEDVIVQFLGEATPEIPRGVIVASGFDL